MEPQEAFRRANSLRSAAACNGYLHDQAGLDLVACRQSCGELLMARHNTSARFYRP
jgi:hypothetical protein